ncbi:MAG TPA: 5'-nucleotidase [Polyangia bacterium]|jgi:beta-phosphoglucomutase-like phosphatase (HAD superfamily)|nr:5'-nucleotidase [Polyangia bacterium]
MSENPRQFVLGVDLDGVVANFYAGLLPIAAEWLGVPAGSLPVEVSYGLTEWGLDAAGGYEDLHRFAVVQRELFRKLEPMPGAAAALRRISQRGVRIRIITHRLFIKYFHEEAVTQTTAWLEHHGIPYWDLCFMKDKAAVGADLYVEDSPENVAALRADGHETIVFRNSTNRQLPPPQAASWAEVEDLVAEHHARWQAQAPAKGVPGR